MIRIPDGRKLAGPIPVRGRRRKTDPDPPSSSEATPDLAREVPGGEEIQQPPRPGRKSPKPPRRSAAAPGSNPSLRLSVGVSRKRGLPGFGSVGASCGLELTLEPGAFETQAFEARVREAFGRCTRAVDDQLDRASAPTHEVNAISAEDPRPEPRTRPCTPAQVRALHALARRLDLDLDALVLRRFDAAVPEALSLAQASRLIAELQPTAPDDSP